MVEGAKKGQEAVVLLHGLARTAASMDKLAAQLATNYYVVNQDYPSREYPIDTLANKAIKDALAQCKQASKVHFVTHSMGGILVRYYLQRQQIKNLAYVVMLGPPNQGSELVDFFKTSNVGAWFFNSVNGPAGSQLGTKGNSVPLDLGPVNFELGVIAGNTNYNPVSNTILDNQNDGKVSVERTKIKGMKDHIVLPVTHTFMMRNRLVIKQIEHFLCHGQFDHDSVVAS